MISLEQLRRVTKDAKNREKHMREDYELKVRENLARQILTNAALNAAQNGQENAYVLTLQKGRDYPEDGYPNSQNLSGFMNKIHQELMKEGLSPLIVKNEDSWGIKIYW